MPPKAPPKPQTWKTPDGKEFTSKAEYRDYMMATFYSFKDIKNATEPQLRGPDSIQGQMFDIGDCENSTLVVMDHTEQVQIDQLKNCRVFIGACASSLFIRNCENCVFFTACQQLRLREVVDCTFYCYSRGEVHIEYSTKLRFAPFNGGYPEQLKHFQAANLDPAHNTWYDVYDHNDPDKTHKNWTLMTNEAEYEAPWFPAGTPCEPAVPRTKVGAVAKSAAAETMQSFSMDQMRTDAATVKVKQTASAPPPIPGPTGADASAAEKIVAVIDQIASAVSSLAASSNTERSIAAATHTGDSDQAILSALITSFATLKAGDDFSTVFAPFATLVVPIGDTPTEMAATDYCAALNVVGVSVIKIGKINVLYCHSEDVHRWRGACAPGATATFWVSSTTLPGTPAASAVGKVAGALVSAMFAKVSADPMDRENEIASWKICHVHQSAPSWVDATFVAAAIA